MGTIEHSMRVCEGSKSHVIGAQVINGNDANGTALSENIYQIIFLVQFN